MEVLRDRDAMRAWSRARRAEGRRIAFVPTMGFLHEGHLSLVRGARERAGAVVASIYVNPTQFGPREDFAVYPRDEAGDLAKLEAAGCDAAFVPADLYARKPDGAPDQLAWVEVEGLADTLCGASRPGFFRGVATVVLKLFHAVEPDVAVFGRKDYQQWRVVSRMVRDLDLPIEVVGLPIVREPDGLAMSSRNARLDPDRRRRATALHRALELGSWLYAQGVRDADTIRARMAALVEHEGGRVDYVELVDRETMAPLAILDRPALAALAVFFGDVRLIDNRELG